MRDHMYIGTTPYEEDCAQVGSDNYSRQSKIELQAFQNQLRRLYPVPNELKDICTLGVKEGEVVCYYDTDNVASLNYALDLESADSKNAKWDVEALQEISAATAQPTKLVKGEYVFMDAFPPCDLCLPSVQKPAAYDAKTTMGPWANVCEGHFQSDTFKVLGTGRAQKFIEMKLKDKCFVASDKSVMIEVQNDN